MFESLKVFFHQGKQYIPDPRTAIVAGNFRGRPVISRVQVDSEAFAAVCPVKAITSSPITIDLGKCVFCGECERCFPLKVRFTKDYHIATNKREALVIETSDDRRISVDPSRVRPEVRKIFSGSLKLRQVSAGGDNSCEWELGAVSNVNFDMGRYGIEFVASPRHADGIVVTGPITKNMARALQLCYDAVPEPKLLILAGTDAISGGIYADSDDIDRSFLENHHVDLYIPGNPCHPLTIINGLLELTGNEML